VTRSHQKRLFIEKDTEKSWDNMGQYKDEMLNPLYITRFVQSGLAGAVLALSAYCKCWKSSWLDVL